jgi:hypothetical protein
VNLFVSVISPFDGVLTNAGVRGSEVPQIKAAVERTVIPGASP